MKTLGKVSDFVGKYMAVSTLLVAALALAGWWHWGPESGYPVLLLLA